MSKPQIAAGSAGPSNEAERPKPGVPVLTKYEFNDIAISAEFLTQDPADAHPVTISQIDWAQTPLKENAGRYAVVLDNVMSPSECEALLRLAEASVPKADGAESWGPALVNIGSGYEVLEPGYRASDRIIWDRQEVVDRLWARCLRAPGLGEKLAVIEDDEDILGYNGGGETKQRWEFRRLNKRMRFLKYQSGQFFRAHCDASYRETEGDKVERTLFTVHLYLNDSKAEAGAAATDLVGGATSFLSRNEKRKIDVDPKAGRVLIFQHYGLYHSGDDVLAGTKYTMRTDIMYELMKK